MKKPAEVFVRQKLHRQEHQRRRAQQKSGHSGRAGRVDHDLADRVVDRPGYHHPDHHQGIFQVFLHGCTSFISFPALSGGKQCFRLCLCCASIRQCSVVFAQGFSIYLRFSQAVFPSISRRAFLSVCHAPARRAGASFFLRQASRTSRAGLFRPCARDCCSSGRVPRSHGPACRGRLRPGREGCCAGRRAS